MVSVCIATYNGEKYLKAQLESILCQISDEDEVIVSDDGSTDSTCAVVESFRDARIRLYHHVRQNVVKKKECRAFYYACENFGYALSVASGDYIFISDQDDLWCDNRMEDMMHALEQGVCAMCNYAVIDGDGKILKDIFHSNNPVSKLNVVNILTHPFTGCCMAIRREALSYILPIPPNCIAHDLWIGCLCNHFGKFVYVNNALHQYRMHESNVSPTVMKSWNSLPFKIRYRYDFLRILSDRVITYKNKR